MTRDLPEEGGTPSTATGVRRILFATDGSAAADRAAAHTIELAARYEAVLHVLFVADTRYRAVFESDGPDRSVRAELVAEGEAATRAVAERASDAGVRAVTTVETGAPAATIAAVAAESGADLVVVGRHGRTRLRRFLIGSVAEGLLNRLSTPVLVVPADGGRRTAYRRIVLAVDGRPAAKAATARALDLAARYDATVVALSVIDERFTGQSSLRAELETVARTAVRDVAVAGAAQGIGVEMVVETGIPADRILDAVADADVVVLGAERHGALDRLTVGSVARRVVRRSTVPVLVGGN